MHEDDVLTAEATQQEAPVQKAAPTMEDVAQKATGLADKLTGGMAGRLAGKITSALPGEMTEEADEAEEPAEPPEDEALGGAIDEMLQDLPEQTQPDAQEILEQAQEASEDTPFLPPKPYHERYYLRYREGKRTTPLDIAGTRAFLEALGIDGGELRQAREGKDCAEYFRNGDGSKGTQKCCSYCGAAIAGVEFYRMRDGRMRCTTCSESVVKTKAEVEAICQRVVANLANFFGATIDVAVSVEVVDERKLKKKVGVPLDTKDSQSVLILGVAVNKKNKYSIILENGAPRISLIATFAHELTHIWQYTHWDNNKNLKKCPKSKRLLIYEGMAKWAEIQYLYMVGEADVAKREEFITRNRQDEYGIGFCLYEDRYPLSREAMTIEETPFTPNSYPF